MSVRRIGEIIRMATSTVELVAFSENWYELPLGLDHVQVKDKLIAESALLLIIGRRIADVVPEVAEPLAQLAAAIRAYDHFDRYRAYIKSYPQAALGVALPTLGLREYGLHDPIMLDELGHALASPYAGSTDRPNFRELEFRWTRAIYEKTDPKCDDLIPFSILNRRIHPAHMRREDAYAFTHAAMYVTDFGRMRLGGELNSSSLGQAMDHMISWCINAADWDLLGELLISEVCLRTHEAAWADTAEQLMNAVYANYGLIPSPNFDASIHQTLSRDLQVVYSHLHAYHSTYVYALLLMVKASVANGASSCLVPSTASISCPEKPLTVLPETAVAYIGPGFDPGWFAADDLVNIDVPIELICNATAISAAKAGNDRDMEAMQEALASIGHDSPVLSETGAMLNALTRSRAPLRAPASI